MERREYEGIGYRLNRFRCNARLTREELANAIGVTKEKIIDYERGTKLPTELEMLNISKTLGVHWDRIIFPGGQRYNV